MQYGVIMAGGAGTRLWPLSREAKPKQLLSVGGGPSLLRVAFDALAGVLPAERIYVATAAMHREAVLEALPDLPIDNVLGEPCGRDTANAVGFSAAVLQRLDSDAVVAVTTSDYIIEPVSEFQKSLREALSIVDEQPKSLVTFGIVPTHAHTGLGHIERGEPLFGHQASYRVNAFKEKPDLATAESYVASGNYYWNSGMFVWRADTVLNELATHLPESYQGLAEIARAWDGPDRQDVVERVFPTLPKISIDYAVMEPAARGDGEAELAVVELPVSWLDVGSWTALATTLDSDPDGNANAAHTVLVDSSGNIIVSDDPEHVIAAVGLQDTIVVHTSDVTMVCPRSAAQRVKDLVTAARDQFPAKFQ